MNGLKIEIIKSGGKLLICNNHISMLQYNMRTETEFKFLFIMYCELMSYFRFVKRSPKRKNKNRLEILKQNTATSV